MEIREASAGDIDGIRDVARASLTASYGHVMDEEIIDSAIAKWYSEAAIAEDVDAADAVFLVAVADGDVVGFAQGYVLENRETIAEIDWLHVVPDFRNQGIGTDLLEHLEQALLEHGVERLEGLVLAENEPGVGFYADRGFAKAGERAVNVGGKAFTEQVYIKFSTEVESAQVVTESRPGPEGEVLYVAYDESFRASKEPFYAVYADHDRTERWGWFCGACESFNTAVDTMDRIECNECGNRRKAARWDAAYL